MSIQEPTQPVQEQTVTEEEVSSPGAEPSPSGAGREVPDIIELRAGSLPFSVVEKLESLPYEKQHEVLDFVEFLAQKSLPKRPRRNVKGLWSDLDIKDSEEDIAEARREMWGNFPREEI